MAAFKCILFAIKKSVYHIEQCSLKRRFFYSTVWNVNKHQEELRLDNNNGEKTQKGIQKLLKIAMLGLPNVGKSTLINQLTRRSMCPTSSKVHTTMHKAEAIYTEDDKQIIFIDTPGITTSTEIKTYKLNESFREDPRSSISEADVIGVIQDVTNVYTRHKINHVILDNIKNKKEDAQLLLILNKVDKLKKKSTLLEVTRILTNNEDCPKFNDIFMISALVGDGVDDLRNYLLDSAKVQDWKYKGDLYTDQPIDIIMEETIRAKLMDVLPFEMPYLVKVTTEHIDFGDDGSISGVVTLSCPKQNYVRVLLRNKAFRIKCLAFYAEQELGNAFRTNASVRINVKCARKKIEHNNK